MYGDDGGQDEVEVGDEEHNEEGDVHVDDPTFAYASWIKSIEIKIV